MSKKISTPHYSQDDVFFGVTDVQDNDVDIEQDIIDFFEQEVQAMDDQKTEMLEPQDNPFSDIGLGDNPFDDINGDRDISSGFEDASDVQELILDDDSSNQRKPKKRKKVRVAEKDMSDNDRRIMMQEVEDKSNIFVFGVQGSGKTFLISSLVYYMAAYSDGAIALKNEDATTEEQLIFNQMIEMFDDENAPLLGRTSTSTYNQLEINYTDSDDMTQRTFSFIDASGEHTEMTYSNVGRMTEGRFPDYLDTMLRSDAKPIILFVYDPSFADKGRQAMTLRKSFEMIQEIESEQKTVFSKAIIITKADLLPNKVLRGGPKNFAYHNFRVFAKDFFLRDEHGALFYNMGTFQKDRDGQEFFNINAFDQQCPELLLEWILEQLKSSSKKTKERSFIQNALKWLRIN